MILQIKTANHCISIPIDSTDPDEVLQDFFALVNQEGNTLVYDIDGELIIIMKTSIEVISILKDMKERTH